MDTVIISFCSFFVFFAIIGLLSSLKKQKSTVDYLLASHSIKPWMSALSAVATLNSGYMFIGMIGFTYFNGLVSLWLMLGWILGDLFSSFYVHQKVRLLSTEHNVHSFSGIMSSSSNNEYIKLRFITGLITLIFLGIYAAAQLKAGSKALHVILGWDYRAGALLGALIVLLYCYAGGIRASIWTDIAQSCVMLAAMSLIVFKSVIACGGPHELLVKLNAIPNYMTVVPQESLLHGTQAVIIFMLGWFFAGIGVTGQPHIMVRFMALDDPKNLNQTRIYYYSWYTLFFILTVIAGLCSRVLLAEQGSFDAELALPSLAHMLLPDILVGLTLAAIFAATMSTADSQILCCTAAITKDMPFKKNITYFLTKVTTIIVTLIALFIALFANDSVFTLVVLSWSALASAFTPLIILRALDQQPSELVSIIMVITGLSVAIIWRLCGLSSTLYEILPGIVAGFIPYLIVNIYNIDFQSYER